MLYCHTGFPQDLNFYLITFILINSIIIFSVEYKLKSTFFFPHLKVKLKEYPLKKISAFRHSVISSLGKVLR